MSDRWPKARRVWHAQQFTIGPHTSEPHRMHPGDNNTPRHEIVERPWLGPYTHWRGSIPAGRLAATGIGADATTLLLTLT